MLSEIQAESGWKEEENEGVEKQEREEEKEKKDKVEHTLGFAHWFDTKEYFKRLSSKSFDFGGQKTLLCFPVEGSSLKDFLIDNLI